MRTFLLTLHVVFAAGVLFGASRRPDIIIGPAALLLIILAGTCVGIWLKRRWAAAPAAALAIGAGGTAIMMLARGVAGAQNAELMRILIALLVVVIVEIATVVHSLRRYGAGGKDRKPNGTASP